MLARDELSRVIPERSQASSALGFGKMLQCIGDMINKQWNVEICSSCSGRCYRHGDGFGLRLVMMAVCLNALFNILLCPASSPESQLVFSDKDFA